MSKQFMLGSTLGALVSISMLAAVPVLAARGDGARRGPGPHFSPERHEEMQSALQNRDYAAWQALMEEEDRGGELLDTITEENFPLFAQMQEKMLAGDREGAETLRGQLGLPARMGGKGCAGAGGEGPGDPDHRAQVGEAIKNRDYAAWKALMGEQPGKGQKMFDTITEENFATFAEMQEKMLAGDREGAQALREQLGIEAPDGKLDEGKGWKKGLFPRGGPRGGGCPMGQMEPVEPQE